MPALAQKKYARAGIEPVHMSKLDTLNRWAIWPHIDAKYMVSNVTFTWVWPRDFKQTQNGSHTQSTTTTTTTTPPSMWQLQRWPWVGQHQGERQVRSTGRATAGGWQTRCFLPPRISFLLFTELSHQHHHGDNEATGRGDDEGDSGLWWVLPTTTTINAAMTATTITTHQQHGEHNDNAHTHNNNNDV